ncbi:MAG TPA: tetratricopeptide repeat protein [Burkholderiales bacterium]|nr:tetratricopeptide repeat protein [Burkholderiales bacterium]
MSLINQMLMDLEKRRAPRPEGVLSEAHALPTQAAGHPRWRYALLALGLVAAVFAWVLQRGITLPSLPITFPPVQTQTAEPAQNLKRKEMSSPVAAAPAPQATTAAAPAQTMENTETPTVSESLLEPASRLSMELGSAPQGSETEPVLRKRAARAKSLALAPVAAKTGPVAEQPLPHINKQVKQETPQQLAEEEYRKAVASMQQGEQIAAQESLRRALQLNPNFTDARLALAGLLLQGRQLAEADSVLREGLELNPRQPGFAMMLARLQVEKGDTQGAVETLRKALPYAANNADYQAFIAALLLQQARYTDAVEHYRTALNLKPAGVWYMGLGMSLQALHRLPEAQDAFQQALTSGGLTPELQAFVEQRLKQILISQK